MDKSKISDRYMVTVIVAGVVSVLVALLNIDVSRVDIYLFLLGVFTIAVGSRMTIQIPRFNLMFLFPTFLFFLRYFSTAANLP